MPGTGRLMEQRGTRPGSIEGIVTFEPERGVSGWMEHLGRLDIGIARPAHTKRNAVLLQLHFGGIEIGRFDMPFPEVPGEGQRRVAEQRTCSFRRDRELELDLGFPTVGSRTCHCGISSNLGRLSAGSYHGAREPK